MKIHGFYLISPQTQYTCVVALGLLLSASSTAAQTRAPIPSTEKQKEISKLLEDGYDLPRLDDAAKKQEALIRLRKSLSDNDLGSDERYVVLMTAISLATQTGSTDEWQKSVDELISGYDVDGTKEKTRLLSEYLKTSKPNAEVKPIADDAIEMSRAAAKEHRFSDALSLISAVDAVSRRASDGAALKPVVAELRTATITLEKDWKSYQSASEKLRADSKDPAANLAVGRWHVAQESDWKAALPFLAKSGDVKWKAAATLDLGMPTDAAQQLAIGDAWWDVAQKESGAVKTALMVHSGEWYQLAMPNLTSALKKQVVAKRLEEIESYGAPRSAVEGSSSQPTAQQVAGEWVDLLGLAEGFDWTPLGSEWASHLGGKPSKQGIILENRAFARYPLPAILDGNYELEAEFTRTEGKGSVGLIFPVGIHNMVLEIGSKGDTTAGVGYIDGKWSNENATTRKPVAVSNDVLHRIKIRVKNDGLQASFQIDWDQRTNFITWQGPTEALVNVNVSNWVLPFVQRPWVVAMNGRTVFSKVRARMTSGALRPDAVTDSDREADRKKGFIRLVGEKPTKFQVASGTPAINQLSLPLSADEGMERRWPLIDQEFRFCKDYYGVRAPSTLKCPIPPGAKSFSVVGYNDSSRAAKYQISIDGKQVHDSGQACIDVIKVAVPPKASSLELVIDPAGSREYDRIYWCFPRFHHVDVSRITEKMIDDKPTMKFAVTSKNIEKEPFKRNEPINASPPVHFRDANPCHEFLFAHATSEVSYSVPAGMTRFTAIGYNVMSQEVKYAVFADGTMIYQSPMAGIVPIDVRLPPGTKSIELKITDEGGYHMDHSMWCYPRLYQK